MAKLQVILLLAIHSLQAVYGQQWVLAADKKSCTEACSNISSACDASKLKAKYDDVTTTEGLSAAFLTVGINCTAWDSLWPDVPFTPLRYAGTTSICMTTSSGSDKFYDCAFAPQSGHRLCWCVPITTTTSTITATYSTVSTTSTLTPGTTSTISSSTSATSASITSTSATNTFVTTTLTTSVSTTSESSTATASSITTTASQTETSGTRTNTGTATVTSMSTTGSSTVTGSTTMATTSATTTISTVTTRSMTTYTSSSTMTFTTNTTSTTITTTTESTSSTTKTSQTETVTTTSSETQTTHTLTTSTRTFNSKADLVAAKKEQASQSISAFDAQEEEAANEALNELFRGGLGSDGKKTAIATVKKPGITVAVLDSSASEDPNQMFSIPAPVDATGFAPKVSLSGSALSAVSKSLGGGSPVAMAAAPVSDELLELVGDILSTSQQKKSDEGTDKAPPPVLATPPLSVNLYRADGTPLKHVQLDEPITLYLKDDAPDNVTCAFFNTTINEWSTAGVRRIYPNASSRALVCETTHLSIFGGILGAFEDIAQTLVCSNIKAFLNAEMWMNVVRDPSWAWETGGITLWIAIGLAGIAIIASIWWDVREARHVASLMDTHSDNVEVLDEHEKYVVLANLHRSKTEAALDEDPAENENDEEEKSKRPSLAKRCFVFAPCILCCAFMFYILKAVWQTLLKLAVKTVKLPNSVHTLLLSLPDAPEHFTKMCVRHSVSAKSGVCKQSMRSSNALDQHAATARQEKQEMLHFLENAFVGRMMLMVLAMHPWMLIFQFSAFISHTARVVLAIAEMFGATAMGAVFYQTYGGALSKLKPPPEECIPRPGLLTEILQAATVATVTCLLADFFVAFLALIRFADYEALEKLPPAKRVEELRHIDNRIALFWVLTVGYILGCISLIIAFLANVTESDADLWLIASGICLLEDFIVIPIALGLLLALVASLFACCSPKLKKIKKEYRAGTDATLDLDDSTQGQHGFVLEIHPEVELREVASPTDLRSFYRPQDEMSDPGMNYGFACTC